MDYIVRYFFYIILGLLVLRLPHGTPEIKSVFNYLIVLSFCLSLPDMISNFPKLKKGGKIIYLFMVSLLVYLFIIRYFKGSRVNINSIIRGLLYPISLINLFMFSLKDDLYGKLKALNIVFIIFIIINTVTIILYPTGWYASTTYTANWFLGYKNVIIRTLLPALTINGIISYHERGRLSLQFIILYFVSLITVTFVLSANSLIMIVVFGLLVFYRPIVSKFIDHKLSLFFAFFIPSTISVLVVFFNFQENFSYFLENYLDRNSTLTSRTYIWEFVLMKIAASPIFGYGYHSAGEWKEVFEFFDRFDISHPHNFLLYNFVQGGLLYFILYTLLLFIISRVIRDRKASGEMFIILSMYWTFFVGGIAESLTECPLMFPMLGLIYTIYESKKSKKIHMAIHNYRIKKNLGQYRIDNKDNRFGNSNRGI